MAADPKSGRLSQFMPIHESHRDPAQLRGLDISFLRQFKPLDGLTDDNLHDIAQRSQLQILPPDKPLFRRGDLDHKTIYILAGELLLLAEDGSKSSFIGGTAPTRLPVDPHQPRQMTAIAKTEVKYFHIDSGYLDLLLSWDASGGSSYQVNDLSSNPSEDDEDWMSNLIQSKLFARIPPNNIQMVLTRMEPVTFNAGEVVIHQGDTHDRYYYYIKSGSCVVTHTGKSGKVIKLAELPTGTGFGEEALISNNPRNATVAMLQSGVLMRLGAEDFTELLKTPNLKPVDFIEARQLLAQGAAHLIDVRLEAEFTQFNLKGSLNIPLYLLRIKSRDLDPKKPILTLCDNGKRSASAAFLLNERGFEARYIEGGLLRIKEIIQSQNPKK